MKDKTYQEIDVVTDNIREQQKIKKYQDQQREREKYMYRVKIDEHTVVLTKNPEKYM